MLIAAFAFDYDGTLAQDGAVDDTTLLALRRVKAGGRKIIMVTGRELPDLKRVFPQFGEFDAIVAENGALLYIPATSEERPLAPAPPAAFLAALERRGVAPLSIGRSIVATWRPNETKALDAIRELGLEWQIIFNKGAVMCLPPGVNKASGLTAALELLELSPLNVVAMGDAENDHAFIMACGCSVAVANAIDTLKAEADIITAHSHGQGVVEALEQFDAAGYVTDLRRHDVLLGEDAGQRPIELRGGSAALIAGASGIGKSRLATAIIERLTAAGFQICVIDPEGDYETLDKMISLGDANRAPLEQEALDVLRKPSASLVVNLLGLPLADRPVFASKLLVALAELRSKLGRPHWIVIDEAHHMAPVEAGPGISLPANLPDAILVSAEPASLARAALEATSAIVAVGPEAPAVIAAYCQRLGLAAPTASPPSDNEVLYWDRTKESPPVAVTVEGPASEHKRHIRKYAKGTLGEDKSFYFRGPKGALNLRAHNLTVFLQMGAGVDEETWLFHLKQKDYSRWVREAIKDDELAKEVEEVETRDLAANASRAAIEQIIGRRYTAPAEA